VSEAPTPSSQSSKRADGEIRYRVTRGSDVPLGGGDCFLLCVDRGALPEVARDAFGRVFLDEQRRCGICGALAGRTERRARDGGLSPAEQEAFEDARRRHGVAGEVSQVSDFHASCGHVTQTLVWYASPAGGSS
jgi:hypothetical protein